MKKYKCIRDYVQCTRTVKDTSTGQLFGTAFERAFVKGNTYQPVKSGEAAVTMKNELGGFTAFDKKVIGNYFEI